MLKVANYNEIIPNLYVGNKYATTDIYLFNLIINCTPDLPFPLEDKQTQKLYEQEQEHIRIPIRDEPFESERLYNILEEQNILYTIKKYISQNKNVLIHCNMGQQRSCAVCACYLLKYGNIDISSLDVMENVIEIIKKKRPMAFFGGINFSDTIARYFLI